MSKEALQGSGVNSEMFWGRGMRRKSERSREMVHLCWRRSEARERERDRSGWCGEGLGQGEKGGVWRLEVANGLSAPTLSRNNSLSL
ncbi:hypothetical protein FCM35_KLT09590 [Carex littledalei]|uniref:Uncharacterized protein n=1 Tax=Carex littledalei TaxID=544730 RepID=A0A833RRW5_9POAL|nr:hypothetical protein FCM35_KLT09590 [Carex littledalei]